jgi:hypothetical protein
MNTKSLRLGLLALACFAASNTAYAQSPRNFFNREAAAERQADPMRNIVRLDQLGKGNGAAFAQNGTANTAATAQVGVNNSGTIQQTGTGNTALLRQHGQNNSGAIIQQGDGNTACYVQVGNNLGGEITQTGSGNSLAVLQNRGGAHEIPIKACMKSKHVVGATVMNMLHGKKN